MPFWPHDSVTVSPAPASLQPGPIATSAPRDPKQAFLNGYPDHSTQEASGLGVDYKKLKCWKVKQCVGVVGRALNWESGRPSSSFFL